MQVLFESERLYYRNFISEDCEEMFLLNADWDVLKYTGDIEFPSIQDARVFLEAYQINTYQKFGYGRVVCVVKKTGEILGWSGLKYHPDIDEVDLGYRLHKRFWNMGYATESSIASLKYAYNHLNINQVAAYALAENIASNRVLEKSGFKFFGMADRYDKTWRRYQINLPFDFNSLLQKE